MELATATMDTIQDLARPLYDAASVHLEQVLMRMDVPTWEIYSAAFQTCAADMVKSTQSSSRFMYLTLKPIIVLIWIFLEVMGRIGQILFQHLLAQGWISAQKGAMQAKAGIVWFYIFQRSLTRTEVLGEIGVCILGVVVYYLRKWLKQQTYVERATVWCGQKKRRIVQEYTKTVNRIAKFSMFLAMLTPHATFIGFAVLFKLLLPRVLQWFALETYTTTILSVIYPVISTIGWIHSQRNPEVFLTEDDKVKTTNDDANKSKADHNSILDKPMPTPEKKSSNLRYRTRATTRTAASPSSKASSTASRKPSYMTSTSAQKSREKGTRSKSDTTTSRLFPKTRPSASPKKMAPNSSNSSLSSTKPSKKAAPVDSGLYWLQYWMVYGCVQVIGRSINLVPIFGRILARQTMLMTLTAEMRLFFYVWIFVMERVLSQTFNTQDELIANALPLNILLRYLKPTISVLHDKASHAVDPETWKSTVVDRSSRLLDVFVLVRFISEPSKKWLVHMIEESRALIVPSITLMMPGFMTQFGVLYVQFILPMAKSLQPHKKEDKASQQRLHLEYWTLNIILAGILQWFSSLLWWVPFSTHVIYILWCYMSLPQTITQSYDIFELELVAFGLVAKPGTNVDIQDTRTMRLMKAVASKLPSASSLEDDDKSNGADSALAAIVTQEDASKDASSAAITNDEDAPKLVDIASQGDDDKRPPDAMQVDLDENDVPEKSTKNADSKKNKENIDNKRPANTGTKRVGCKAVSPADSNGEGSDEISQANNKTNSSGKSGGILGDASTNK